MERTVRRSMRLAKQNRQKRRNRAAAKRLRSPIERNRDRMSVGEVMGLSPAASYAVNLSEARAMNSVRAAAANAGAGTQAPLSSSFAPQVQVFLRHCSPVVIKHPNPCVLMSRTPKHVPNTWALNIV